MEIGFVQKCIFLRSDIKKSHLKEHDFVPIHQYNILEPLTCYQNNLINILTQFFEISLTSQRIILRYLSNCFGSRLVVPEYCIDELGQNHVPPQCDFFISDRKKIHFWTKPISKFLI